MNSINTMQKKFAKYNLQKKVQKLKIHGHICSSVATILININDVKLMSWTMTSGLSHFCLKSEMIQIR